MLCCDALLRTYMHNPYFCVCLVARERSGEKGVNVLSAT